MSIGQAQREQDMTDAQRRAAIQKLIADYTATYSVDKKTARDTLIKEGIYTKKGALRVEFGGKSKKARSAA
jgi:hypothetical protein